MISLTLSVLRYDPALGADRRPLVVATFERDGVGFRDLKITVDGADKPLGWLTPKERSKLSASVDAALTGLVPRRASR